MSFDIEKFREFGLTDGEKHFRRLIKAMEIGEQPPIETLQFLADAGRKILDSDDAKNALKLKKSRGRKKDTEFYKWMDLVTVICLLMDERNFSKDKAISAVADALSGEKGHTYSTIEDRYDNHQQRARERYAAEKEIEKIRDAYLAGLFDPQK